MNTNGIASSFEQHNHEICNQHYTNKMEKYCVEITLKLTFLRGRVLEILIRDHKPLGAYQSLEILKKEGFAFSPPIAYRVLDFLVERGFALQIQGLNSFIACSFAGSEHFPAFIMCRKCENVAEIQSENAFPKDSHTALNFKIENAIIEIFGTCSACDMSGVA
ncbi:transcriptional repressor [Paracoccaceae bacterium]|nr:transcriptional repressor [Paracoccaceae bacterium]